MLGAPGSGRGGQADLIAGHYHIPKIALNELVRSAIAAGTPFGQQARATMDEGQAIPEEVLIGLVGEKISALESAGGFLLLGFPRNLVQADALDQLLQSLHQPLDLVLLVDVDNDALMERLTGRRTCVVCGKVYNIYTAPPSVDGVCDECGGRLHHRADDNEETIGNRLRVYESQTTPVIKYYEGQGKLRRVPGLEEEEETFRAVQQCIEEIPTARQRQTAESARISGGAKRALAGAEEKRLGRAGAGGGKTAARKVPKSSSAGMTAARKAQAELPPAATDTAKRAGAAGVKKTGKPTAKGTPTRVATARKRKTPVSQGVTEVKATARPGAANEAPAKMIRATAKAQTVTDAKAAASGKKRPLVRKRPGATDAPRSQKDSAVRKAVTEQPARRPPAKSASKKKAVKKSPTPARTAKKAPSRQASPDRQAGKKKVAKKPLAPAKKAVPQPASTVRRAAKQGAAKKQSQPTRKMASRAKVAGRKTTARNGPSAKPMPRAGEAKKHSPKKNS